LSNTIIKGITIHFSASSIVFFCIILIEYDAESYLMMQKETHNEAL